MQEIENEMLRKTILSAVMLLARNDVGTSDAGDGKTFSMKVDGIDHNDFQAMIVKEVNGEQEFFSILAFQGELASLSTQPSVWLSVNANGTGTYAIHGRLNQDGAWALYNDAEGVGFDFLNRDAFNGNGGFVSTCGAFTISRIDPESRRISGRFQFNASNASGKTKTISEGSFDNLSYFEQP